jgi:hypothetical protein
MSLEANKFLGRLYGEAVANQQRQDEEIRQAIKGRKEVQEVLETKQLKELDFQKFRRTYNEFIKDVDYALNVIENYVPTGDATEEFNTLNKISDLAMSWNNVVISLSIMGYKNLEQKDKTKIYEILKSMRGSLETLLQYITDGRFVDSNQQQKVLNQIIGQLNTNIYDQISL